jgi:hypothetical protein
MRDQQREARLKDCIRMLDGARRQTALEHLVIERLNIDPGGRANDSAAENRSESF